MAIAKARSTFRSELGSARARWAAARTVKAHNATTVRKPIRRQLLPKSENSGRDDNAAATPYQITWAAARRAQPADRSFSATVPRGYAPLPREARDTRR